MSNRPKFPPSQPTISMNNLPALEELSSEEASAISGGGAGQAHLNLYQNLQIFRHRYVPTIDRT